MEEELISRILSGGVGVIALLILILWLGKNNIWVWARELEAMRVERERERVEKDTRLTNLESERDMWRELALQGTALMEHASKGSH